MKCRENCKYLSNLDHTFLQRPLSYNRTVGRVHMLKQSAQCKREGHTTDLFPSIGQSSTQFCNTLLSLIYHMTKLLVVMETLHRLQHSVFERVDLSLHYSDLLSLSEVLPSPRHRSLHVLIHLYCLIDEILYLVRKIKELLRTL